MFSFADKSQSGDTIYLDIRDETLKKIDPRLEFGMIITCPQQLKDIAGRGLSIRGVCKEGYLWYQMLDEEGIVHPQSKNIERIILTEGRFFVPLKSLQDLTVSYVKSNSDAIKTVLHNQYESSNDCSYKTIYAALLDLGLKHGDAPALFDELIQKCKEETLIDRVDYLQSEVQALEKSNNEMLEMNKLIIKQNQELLSFLKNNQQRYSSEHNVQDEKKPTCAYPSIF